MYDGLVTWDGTTVVKPSVYLRDTGYIAIEYAYQIENPSGFFNGANTFWSGWSYTQQLQGGQSYTITPDPIRIQAPDIRQWVGLVWVFFSYSADAQNWSPVETDVGSTTGYFSGDNLGLIGDNCNS